ncbi:MAG: rubrerythrin family protein [Desulfobacteraceae bacterium]
MSKTRENLMAAFAGESQANRKYLAFAKKADQEGFPRTARLFRAAAEAETIHAHNHLRALDAIKSTKENLQEAISGETHEFTAMYPQMIAEAEAEGNKRAVQTFRYANEVEKTHASLYQQALEHLDDQTLVDVHICPVCGYTVEGEPPEACPVCRAKKKSFLKVD